MNLSTFIQSQTERMLAFEQYWLNKIVPAMDEQERAFWEGEASVWEWIEQLEDSGL